jgi:hypothetical protein
MCTVTSNGARETKRAFFTSKFKVRGFGSVCLGGGVLKLGTLGFDWKPVRHGTVDDSDDNTNCQYGGGDGDGVRCFCSVQGLYIERDVFRVCETPNRG